MATLVNVHLPPNKSLFIALQRIYGIGWKTSKDICTHLNLDPNIKVKDLSGEDEERLNTYIDQELTVEDKLRLALKDILKREEIIKSYKYSRFLKGLPANGQRTKSNAETSRRLKGKR